MGQILFFANWLFLLLHTLNQWMLQLDSNPQTHDHDLIVLPLSYRFWQTLFFGTQLFSMSFSLKPNDCLSRIQTLKHIIKCWLFYHWAIATGKTLFFDIRLFSFCLLLSPNDCFSRIQTLKHMIMSSLFYHWAITTGKTLFFNFHFFPFVCYSCPMIA